MVLSAIAGLFGFGIWSLRVDEPVQFRTAPVQRDDLMVVVTASGTVEPVEIVDVGAQVAGRITLFGADPDDPAKTIDYGSRVSEGTVLAQIDESTFQATVERTQANLNMAIAQLDVAKAQLRHAEKDWRRAEQLNATDSITDSEHDKLLAAYDTAQGEVAISEARILQARAALRLAQVDLGYVTIKSPIDGVVIDRRVNVGQTVVAGLDAPSLFLLAKDLTRLEVWASVNEADIGMIRLDQPVEFTVDAFPQRQFTGIVKQIRLNARMTQNVVTYTVIVACDNRDGKLLPYMTANLKFEVARRDQVLVVPNRALRWRPALEQVVPEHRDGLLEGAFPQASLAVRRGPAAQSGSKPEAGVLWAEAGEGRVQPVRVQIGLTDGLRAEVTGDELDAQMRVVIGQVSTQDDVGDFTSTFVRLPKED